MNRSLSATMHYLRPAWWLCIWVHFLLGGLLALGKSALSMPFDEGLRAVVAGGLWAVCLGGAAAAVSAVYATPKDEPPDADATPPLFVGWAGLVLMLVGLVGALILFPAWWFFDVYLTGIVLLVLHGTPPIRLARWPVPGALLEAAGLGALTLYAGHTVVGTLTRPDVLLTVYLIGFGFLILAIRVLLSAESGGLIPVLYLVCLVNAFACLGLAQVRQERGWGLALLTVPFLGWGLLGLERYSDSGRHRPRARTGTALMLCVLTDVAVGASCLLM